MKNRKGGRADIWKPGYLEALGVELAAFRSADRHRSFRRAAVAEVWHRLDLQRFSISSVRQAYVKFPTPTLSQASLTCQMSRVCEGANLSESAADRVGHCLAASERRGQFPAEKPTDLALHRQTDDGRVLNMLAVWAPDAALRKMILVDNLQGVRLLGIRVVGWMESTVDSRQSIVDSPQ